jgi:predicted nucleotidyltransferase
MNSLVDALLAVHETLDASGVAHALCGGIAANLYREDVRATMDVDLYIAVGAAELVALSRRFEEDGWEARPYWRKGDLLRLMKGDMPPVDCLIASTPYEVGALNRAVPASIDGHAVPVLTAEDLIVFKLVAGRARDYEAVAAMINALGKKLDAKFITETLTDLGFEDRWQRAKEEAEREAQSL